MTEHTITRPLLRDTVPEQMRHVALSLAGETELEAAVIYMDSTGFRISMDETTGEKLPEIAGKEMQLEIDFLEIPLHVAAECVRTIRDVDGKLSGIDMIISNPFQQRRYRNFLQHCSTRSEIRCLVDK